MARINLVDEIVRFTEFLNQNEPEGIRTHVDILTSYISTGKENNSTLSIKDAFDNVKEYMDWAQTFLRNSDFLKEDEIPPIVAHYRTIAGNLVQKCSSFWEGSPSDEQFCYVEKMILLNNYLAEIHDQLETACQEVADFNNQHNEIKPVNVDRVPSAITDARAKIASIVAKLEKMTKDRKHALRTEPGTH